MLTSTFDITDVSTMSEEPLDYHPNSGATSKEDVLKDHKHPDTERSEGDVGETTFDPRDAPSDKRSRFNELRKRHHEHWNSSGKEERDTAIAYDARVVFSQLELSETQRNRSLKLIEEYRSKGRRYEAVILAAVTLVLNQHGRWIQRDNEQYGDDLHEQYVDLRESFDVDESQIQDLIREMRPL